MDSGILLGASCIILHILYPIVTCLLIYLGRVNCLMGKEEEEFPVTCDRFLFLVICDWYYLFVCVICIIELVFVINHLFFVICHFHTSFHGDCLIVALWSEMNYNIESCNSISAFHLLLNSVRWSVMWPLFSLWLVTNITIDLPIVLAFTFISNNHQLWFMQANKMLLKPFYTTFVKFILIFLNT